MTVCTATCIIETISNDFDYPCMSKKNDKIELFSCSHDFHENTIQTISNDLREPKNKQSRFRKFCNAGLHGKCTGSKCSCRMILHEIVKTDAGTYIARNPMQGIIMHGKELMHGLSNAGENLMHGFLLHESIMHEKNIAGAHKSANPSAKTA